MSPDVAALTAEYERWLGGRIPLVADDLRAKHEALAGPVLRFLRGTYYLWLVRTAELLPHLHTTVPVPAVGDLHVENFGTWRDAHGVRRWGVNDLDELTPGSAELDLVRVATSAVLAPDVALPPGRLCAVLLDGWHTARPGTAVAVDDAPHLPALVPVRRDADAYYAALAAGAPVDPPPPRVRDAAVGSGPPTWHPTWHRRRAGTGSLGHPRLVAVGPDADGAPHAREVKLLGPPTAAWLGRPVPGGGLYDRVVDALSGPYPGGRVDGWQLRRLAPDVVRVELSGLRAHDCERVVRSMAYAAADVHGADPDAFAAARAQCARRADGWLHDAVEVMAADTHDCHHAWRRATAGR